jgi:indole-3-glycerol phosphate synthase
MHSHLKTILDEKRKEIDKLKSVDGLPRTREHYERRDFRSALAAPGRISLIAEIKFASPSAGVIREKIDPLPIARLYESAGAAAISFLTEEKFFGGDLAQLPRLKRTVALPILRKDFILDEIQVKESALNGADAVLLIARALSAKRLKELISACNEHGIDPLTEVHDAEDLEKALECGAEIIGVNNRDLETFAVDLTTTMQLVSRIPVNCVVVSESGIADGKDIRLLQESRVDAVLVGSSIMRSSDMETKVRELVEAGYQRSPV